MERRAPIDRVDQQVEVGNLHLRSSISRIVVSSSSRDVASGIQYLLSSLGVVASTSRRDPATLPSGFSGEHGSYSFKTTHPHWATSVSSVDDLRRIREVWNEHPRAAPLRARLESGGKGRKREFVKIGGDLIALRVRAVRDRSRRRRHRPPC
jgi:hypothetical protein